MTKWQNGSTNRTLHLKLMLYKNQICMILFFRKFNYQTEDLNTNLNVHATYNIDLKLVNGTLNCLCCTGSKQVYWFRCHFSLQMFTFHGHDLWKDETTTTIKQQQNERQQQQFKQYSRSKMINILWHFY